MNERRAARRELIRPAADAEVPPPSRPHDPRRLLVSPDLVTRGLVGCPALTGPRQFWQPIRAPSSNSPCGPRPRWGAEARSGCGAPRSVLEINAFLSNEPWFTLSGHVLSPAGSRAAAVVAGPGAARWIAAGAKTTPMA